MVSQDGWQPWWIVEVASSEREEEGGGCDSGLGWQGAATMVVVAWMTKVAWLRWRWKGDDGGEGGNSNKKIEMTNNGDR